MKQLGYLRYIDLVDLDWMSFCFVSVLSFCLNATFVCVCVCIYWNTPVCYMFQQIFAIIRCTIHRMTDCNALILNYKVHWYLLYILWNYRSNKSLCDDDMIILLLNVIHIFGFYCHYILLLSQWYTGQEIHYLCSKGQNKLKSFIIGSPLHHLLSRWICGSGDSEAPQVFKIFTDNINVL